MLKIDIDNKIVYTLKEDEKGFEINKINGEFVVSGPDVDRLVLERRCVLCKTKEILVSILLKKGKKKV